MQGDASLNRQFSDGPLKILTGLELRTANTAREPLGRRTLLAFALGFTCVTATIYGTGGDFSRAFALDNAGMYDFLANNVRRKPNYAAPVFYTPFGRSPVGNVAAPLFNSATAPDSLRKGSLRGFGKLPHGIAPLRQARSNQPRRLAGATDVALNIDASSLPRRTYCVRLCDGYYFPVAPVSSDGDLNAHESLCAGICSGSPTRLYVMPGGSERIEDAVSREGKTYSALPVAFRHTGTTDNTCTCRPNNIAYTKVVSVMKDFTLRQGDMVMGNKGFRVFRGSAHYPYGQSDFMSLAESGVNSKNMAALAAIESAVKRGGSSRVAEPALPKPETTASVRPSTPVVVDETILQANGKRIRRIGPQVVPSE